MPLWERNNEKYEPFLILRYFNILSEVRILWKQNIAEKHNKISFIIIDDVEVLTSFIESCIEAIC
jgi:hypothetical protein